MPDYDCAAVERDNLDLHQALTEALHRIQELRSELGRYVYLDDTYGVADLIEALDRTSRPAVK